MDQTRGVYGAGEGTLGNDFAGNPMFMFHQKVKSWRCGWLSGAKRLMVTYSKEWNSELIEDKNRMATEAINYFQK